MALAMCAFSPLTVAALSDREKGRSDFGLPPADVGGLLSSEQANLLRRVGDNLRDRPDLADMMRRAPFDAVDDDDAVRRRLQLDGSPTNSTCDDEGLCKWGGNVTDRTLPPGIIALIGLPDLVNNCDSLGSEFFLNVVINGANADDNQGVCDVLQWVGPYCGCKTTPPPPSCEICPGGSGPVTRGRRTPPTGTLAAFAFSQGETERTTPTCAEMEARSFRSFQRNRRSVQGRAVEYTLTCCGNLPNATTTCEKPGPPNELPGHSQRYRAQYLPSLSCGADPTCGLYDQMLRAVPRGGGSPADCDDLAALGAAQCGCPTDTPTVSPATDMPTVSPTLSSAPSASRPPSTSPSAEPSGAPTNEPTSAPTDEPTPAPTADPTPTPVDIPTPSPVVIPPPGGNVIICPQDFTTPCNPDQTDCCAFNPKSGKAKVTLKPGEKLERGEWLCRSNSQFTTAYALGVLSSSGTVHVLQNVGGGWCEVLWTMGGDNNKPSSGTELKLEDDGVLALREGGSTVDSVGCSHDRRRRGLNSSSGTKKKYRARVTDVREEKGDGAKVAKIFYKGDSFSKSKKKKKKTTTTTKKKKHGSKSKKPVTWWVTLGGNEKTTC